MIEQVEGLLPEVRLVMNLVLVVRCRVTRQCVENAKRLRCDEAPPNDREGPEVSGVEVLAQRERTADAVVEAPRRRAGEVVVDLIIGHSPFGDAAEVRRARAVDRTSLEALVVGDVGA